LLASAGKRDWLGSAYRLTERHFTSTIVIDMRSEQEMLDLILDTARQDERIRAVIMNGSRANPNAPRDFFQDFDIVYVVSDVAPFKHNDEWIKRFGKLGIIQLPEDMRDPPPAGDGHFAYLMQFADGNRLDLGIYSASQIEQLAQDSLGLLLLDKDGAFEPFPPPSEEDYLPTPPTAKAFADCCNEFWWVCPYVAKGLWREEILYAKYYLDRFVRDQLTKMMGWYVGVRTRYQRNPGKYGKYLRQYLEPELWEMLLRTYSDADYEHTWQALFATCELFRRLAIQVAGHFHFDYPHADDEWVSSHLAHVKGLPRDAQQMY
jgi:aminoglycoside 6-adenylyltransferase